MPRSHPNLPSILGTLFTSLAGFLDGADQDANDRKLGELKKELRNVAAMHRKRISVEVATIIQKLTELKTETVEAGPPTLVAGETAHIAEKSPV